MLTFIKYKGSGSAWAVSLLPNVLFVVPKPPELPNIPPPLLFWLLFPKVLLVFPNKPPPVAGLLAFFPNNPPKKSHVTHCVIILCDYIGRI